MIQVKGNLSDGLVYWTCEQVELFSCIQFESRPVDAEYVSLMHDLQSTEIHGHIYRGYTLLTQDGRKLRSIQVSGQLHMYVLAYRNFGILFVIREGV
jgi:hypothetical protein